MTKADSIVGAALVVILILIAPAAAQTAEELERLRAEGFIRQEQPARPQPEEDIEYPAEPPYDVRMIDGKMTLNLPSVTFNTFLKLISMHSDMRLMTSDEIGQRKLSIYLPDVTPMEALDAVCSAYGLFLQKIPHSDVYLIKDIDVEFIKLEYINAGDLERLVPTLVEGGRVTIDERNNIIAIQGNRAGIERVRALVERMDVPPRQALIQATLAEISDDADRKLGIRWEPSVFFRGASRQTLFPFRRQWADIHIGNDAFSYGVVSFADFFVQLQALERQGEAKILANPRVAVLDGREADIRITSNIVIATSLTRSGTGLDIVTEEPIFADVGVTLKAIPKIHSDNSVTLIVEPSVSTAARSRFFDQAVDTFDRSARTTVLVDDGETIAIGGLIRNDSIETDRTIPFISKIPILGRVFFHHQDRVTEQTDLVVFITPTVLNRNVIREDAGRHQQRFDR